jgi:hypothetical protein
MPIAAGRTSAQHTGDTASVAAARYAALQAMPIEAAAATRRVANRVFGQMQGEAADVKVRQMLGQLHLSTALACAVESRDDDAAAHLTAAEDEARTLGDPQDGAGFNVLAFGPTNVGLWRMAVAAEHGEWGRVIDLSARVNPGPLRVASRHQAYWLEYGRALAHSGKRDPEARAAFLCAEQAAPVPFSVNPMAHETILTMYNRARRAAIPDDLRVLALRVGIEVPAA